MVFAALCLFVLVTTWQLVNISHSQETIEGQPIRTIEEAHGFLAKQPALSSNAYQVPTGVNINTLEFISSHDVRITGYVWQHYGPFIPADIKRGLVLPEAREAQTLTEAYRRTNADGSELIGWFFSAVVRQEFDYTKYPLDRQDVWLRLWHSDFDRRVVLIPDFAAYPPWADHRMLGLDSHYANVSFQPDYTVFSYVLTDYRGSFGLGEYAAGPAHPELYFNVGLDRRFRGPLGETLAPLSLVCLLVFAAIFITSVDHERRNKIGFSTLATLTLTMSAGFIVVTRHKTIIENTDVAGLVYIELLPYMLYLLIGVAALNAVFYAATDIRWLHWRHNLLPALLFWPLVTSSLLIASLMVLVG